MSKKKHTIKADKLSFIEKKITPEQRLLIDLMDEKSYRLDVVKKLQMSGAPKEVISHEAFLLDQVNGDIEDLKETLGDV